jgi:nitroreductase
MDALEALFTRRSVRSFTDEPVSPEEIETIVKAGMYAPSGHDIRAWRFMTITNRETLDAIADLSEYWFMLKKATLAVVVCCAMDERQGFEIEMCLSNTSAATENILLAAHALGLGGVWLGVQPTRKFYPDLKALLNIPENMRPTAIVAIGHRKKPLKEADRFEPEKWIKEKWE